MYIYIYLKKHQIPWKFLWIQPWNQAFGNTSIVPTTTAASRADFLTTNEAGGTPENRWLVAEIWRKFGNYMETSNIWIKHGIKMESMWKIWD